MSGAHSSADDAQPGRRVSAGVPITFHGPASACERPMLRLGAVAAPTYPTRDSTTVGSANARDHRSGAGIPVTRAAASAGGRSVMASGTSMASGGEDGDEGHGRRLEQGVGPGHAL